MWGSELDNMARFDLDGGCLTGLYGLTDSEGLIEQLGFIYDPEISPSKWAAPTVIGVLIGLCCFFCIVVPSVFIYFEIEIPWPENENKIDDKAEAKMALSRAKTGWKNVAKNWHRARVTSSGVP